MKKESMDFNHYENCQLFKMIKIIEYSPRKNKESYVVIKAGETHYKCVILKHSYKMDKKKISVSNIIAKLVSGLPLKEQKKIEEELHFYTEDRMKAVVFFGIFIEDGIRECLKDEFKQHLNVSIGNIESLNIMPWCARFEAKIGVGENSFECLVDVVEPIWIKTIHTVLDEKKVYRMDALLVPFVMSQIKKDKGEDFHLPLKWDKDLQELLTEIFREEIEKTEEYKLRSLFK